MSFYKYPCASMFVFSAHTELVEVLMPMVRQAHHER